MQFTQSVWFRTKLIYCLAFIFATVYEDHYKGKSMNQYVSSCFFVFMYIVLQPYTYLREQC